MSVVINGTSGITFPNGVTMASGTSAPVTVAQGGTGLTSPGTSGYVLTSNGTGWVSSALPAGGVTSWNGQTGAVTSTAAYDLGSFVTGRPQNTTAYAVNNTVAGSSLYATFPGAYWNPNDGTWKTGGNSGVPSNGVVLVNTGSWKCVAPCGNNGNPQGWAGLWVRYA